VRSDLSVAFTPHLGETCRTPLRMLSLQSNVRLTKYHGLKIGLFGDLDMSRITKVAAVAAFVAAALGGLSSEASARGRLYPLTRCGPGLAYLCPIHGYFDQAPFHYSAAIYPGCIKTVAIETPNGVERRKAVVCGAPERQQIWW
jgi:hypothetical protein